MSVVTHQMDANCAPQRLWTLLSDLEAVANYNPMVRASRVKGGRARGVGAQRECDLSPGGRVVERVTVWDEGRALGLEIVQSDWPIDFMRWVTRVEPNGSGSRLTQSLEYQIRFGPIGWLLAKLVMQRKLRRNVEAALRGLIRAAESAA